MPTRNIIVAIVFAYGDEFSRMLTKGEFSPKPSREPAWRTTAAASARGARLWWTLPVVFLLMLRFGSEPSLDLDPSWSEVLKWGFVQGRQWGTDLVFTYGPLGFLHPLASYFPGLPGHDRLFLIAQILIALGEATLIALALRNLSNLAAVGLIAVLIIWARWFAGDAQWYATFAFAFVVVANSADEPFQKRRWLAWLALSSLLATIALIKFTSTVLFGLWLVFALTLLCLRRRRRDAATLIVCAGFAYGALWPAAGQHLGGLPTYLLASLEVASGYTSAMSMSMSARIETIALVAILTNAIWLAWMFTRMRSRITALLATGFLACLLFLVWRGGMTRGDHFAWFLGFTGILPFIAMTCAGRYRSSWSINAASLAAVIFSIAVFVISDPAPVGSIVTTAMATVTGNTNVLLHPQEFLQSRRAQFTGMQDSIHLPRIHAVVGDESVDMMMVEQGMMLAGGFNYQPRPIFQSYNAWTPALLRMNEAFFAGDNAPHFVILKLQPIDGRLPMQEDGLALIALLKRYRPCLVEAGYVLLERTENPVSPIRTPTEGEYHDDKMGEIFTLADEGTPKILFIETKLNIYGKSRSLLIREPELSLLVKLASGENRNYRLSRLNAESGFVVSPLIDNVNDWLGFDGTEKSKQVVGIAIWPNNPAHSGLFDPSIRIAVAELKGPFAATDHSIFAEQKPYSKFSHVQVDQSAAFNMVRESDQDVLFMHAPAWLDFELSPGSYRIEGAFGIRNAALTSPNCSGADGVRLSFSAREDGELNRIIWEAAINPFLRVQDRGTLPIVIDSFMARRHSIIRVQFDPGTNNNVICDWSFLSGLRFSSIENSTISQEERK